MAKVKPEKYRVGTVGWYDAKGRYHVGTPPLSTPFPYHTEVVIGPKKISIPPQVKTFHSKIVGEIEGIIFLIDGGNIKLAQDNLKNLRKEIVEWTGGW